MCDVANHMQHNHKARVFKDGHFKHLDISDFHVIIFNIM